MTHKGRLADLEAMKVSIAELMDVAPSEIIHVGTEEHFIMKDESIGATLAFWRKDWTLKRFNDVAGNDDEDGDKK